MITVTRNNCNGTDAVEIADGVAMEVHQTGALLIFSDVAELIAAYGPGEWAEVSADD
jgi:hypothetical protein